MPYPPAQDAEESGAHLTVGGRGPHLNFIGRRLLYLIETVKGLGAFALISVGVACTKFRVASRVIHPLIRQQIYRDGVRLLPLVSFTALALGFVVIGQTVTLLTRVGAQGWAGTIMVAVIVREVGPLTTALLVLVRVGTGTVIELATARAMGEVNALEAMGIDPIHYLVVPRFWGLSLSIFALSIYLILFALIGGYLFAFLEDIPILPTEYVRQLAAALSWKDFVILAVKTTSFGGIIAVVTCHAGLAKPLLLENVSSVATSAVVLSLGLCIGVDALFIISYLITP